MSLGAGAIILMVKKVNTKVEGSIHGNLTIGVHQQQCHPQTSPGIHYPSLRGNC